MKTQRPAVDKHLKESQELRASLRKAEAEIQRLLDEAAARGALVDILHDVMGSLSMGELFHMLARRLAWVDRVPRSVQGDDSIEPVCFT